MVFKAVYKKISAQFTQRHFADEAINPIKLGYGWFIIKLISLLIFANFTVVVLKRDSVRCGSSVSGRMCVACFKREAVKAE